MNTKQIICKKCNGIGRKSQFKACIYCKGLGKYIILVPEKCRFHSWQTVRYAKKASKLYDYLLGDKSYFLLIAMMPLIVLLTGFVLSFRWWFILVAIPIWAILSITYIVTIDSIGRHGKIAFLMTKRDKVCVKCAKIKLNTNYHSRRKQKKKRF